ncbi:hypothetical protein C7M84_025460 [Penaeus vannamei]|uniref:Uncharacterized protein n=1 Tax=Penaeus vannamei TaxID=6689 RepID=A0A423TY32_PENVA|nr:hypothetical protein C7M84_025460 [Penaeus vannamei]
MSPLTCLSQATVRNPAQALAHALTAWARAHTTQVSVPRESGQGASVATVEGLPPDLHPKRPPRDVRLQLCGLTKNFPRTTGLLSLPCAAPDGKRASLIPHECSRTLLTCLANTPFILPPIYALPALHSLLLTTLFLPYIYASPLPPPPPIYAFPLPPPPIQGLYKYLYRPCSYLRFPFSSLLPPNYALPPPPLYLRFPSPSSSYLRFPFSSLLPPNYALPLLLPYIYASPLPTPPPIYAFPLPPPPIYAFPSLPSFLLTTLSLLLPYIYAFPLPAPPPFSYLRSPPPPDSPPAAASCVCGAHAPECPGHATCSGFLSCLPVMVAGLEHSHLPLAKRTRPHLPSFATSANEDSSALVWRRPRAEASTQSVHLRKTKRGRSLPPPATTP